MVDEVVEFELIELAGIEPGKPRANVFEKASELSLVVCRDLFSRGPPLRLVVNPILGVAGSGHGLTISA